MLRRYEVIYIIDGDTEHPCADCCILDETHDIEDFPVLLAIADFRVDGVRNYHRIRVLEYTPLPPEPFC